MPNRDITNIRLNYKITFIYVEILFKKIFDVIYNIFIKKHKITKKSILSKKGMIIMPN